MSSKSGRIFVSTDKIVAIAQHCNLQINDRAGWFRAESADGSRRLLVHKGKRGTNCIELVGFTSPAAVRHPCPPAKTMEQLIDMTSPEVTEASVLKAVFICCKQLASIAPPAEQGPGVDVRELVAELEKPAEQPAEEREPELAEQVG